MGFTKEWIDRIERERRETDAMNRADGCGCYYNWNDKFQVYCPAHEAAEMAEIHRDAEAAEMMNDDFDPNAEIADGVFF